MTMPNTPDDPTPAPIFDALTAANPDWLAGATARLDDIKAAIERSGLGTPGARSLRGLEHNPAAEEAELAQVDEELKLLPITEDYNEAIGADLDAAWAANDQLRFALDEARNALARILWATTTTTIRQDEDRLNTVARILAGVDFPDLQSDLDNTTERLQQVEFALYAAVAATAEERLALAREAFRPGGVEDVPDPGGLLGPATEMPPSNWHG